MGISCRPWGPIKSDFDKLSYQMKKEAELAKKFGKKTKKKNNEQTTNS